MANELLQPLESLITGGITIKNTATTAPTTATIGPTPPPPHPSLTQPTAPASLDNPGPSLAPKRQLPAYSYVSQVRRAKYPWRFTKDFPSKSSVKTRSLTNVVNGVDSHEIACMDERNPTGEDLNFKYGYRRAKAKQAAVSVKRVQSNWVSNSSRAMKLLESLAFCLIPFECSLKLYYMVGDGMGDLGLGSSGVGAGLIEDWRKKKKIMPTPMCKKVALIFCI